VSEAGLQNDLELLHPGGRSRIRISPRALARPDERLLRALEGRLTFLVSSRGLLELHGARLEELSRAAGAWVVLEVPDGEAAKRLDVAEDLWRRMLRAGGKRDSVVVGFGGGTVCDLAGFIAAGFLRGVECVHLPSSLLAQVDAAIGGKTAVNLPEAKNSVGMFHHPSFVVCDTSVLETLPEAELRSGLFEVVKIGAIWNPALLPAVRAGLERLLAADAGALAPVVADAVRAKIEVVERDPEEGDLRRLLNFGHTLGHALEAHFGYAGLRHGEAVGYGMLFALRLARRRGLAAAEAETLCGLIRDIGLPPLEPAPTEPVLERLGRDKKAREEGLGWVYPRALGEGVIDSEIPLSEVKSELEAFLVDPWA
jgi:3-dehydroquinate synthase